MLGIGKRLSDRHSTLGQRFILSIKRGSVARHIKTLGAMGIPTGWPQTVDRPRRGGPLRRDRTRARLEVGARMRDADRADVHPRLRRRPAFAATFSKHSAFR
ncbi:MAG: hypothetical protein HPM95_20145 [Alphaproteobacteria bacterium]|nr:hypothetical protein [Alphaproteobacteria bacterium]